MENNNENIGTEKKGFFKKLIDDVTTNIKEGASLVGEKVAEGATFVGGKVAETSAKAYVASSELVSETSEKIHDYTEKQLLHKEEERIHSRQQKISNEFGALALSFYLENKDLNTAFLTDESTTLLLNEHKKNIERLLELTKILKENKSH